MKRLFLLLVLMPMVALAQFPLPYCAETFSEVLPIKRFKFSNIDNFSSDILNGSQHEDFTSKTIKAFSGSTYQITVDAYCISTNGYDQLRVGIDYNNDGIFQPSETTFYTFDGEVNFGFRTVTFDLFIPYNQPAGNYRVRVLKTFEYPGFCETKAVRKGQAEDYTIHIDNPTCYPPYYFSVSDKNYNSATLAWLPPAVANLPTGYNWELRLDSLPGTNTNALISSGNLPVSFSQQSFNLVDLKALTSYNFYIRSNCQGTFSEWQLINFTTSFCGNSAYYYTEDFINYIAPKLSDCITVQDVNGDGIKWEKEDGEYNNINHNNPAIHITSNGLPAADDWFFTPFRKLLAGQVYVLQFLYKGANADAGAIQNFEVVLGTEQYAAGTRKVLFTQNDIASLKTAPYQTGRVIFIPDSSGAYTLGFHCWSNANKVDFYVDNIIFSANNCTWPDSINISKVTGNSVRFNWKKGYTNLANPSFKWEIRNKGATPAGPSYTLAASGTTNNPTDSAFNLLVGTSYSIFIKTECEAGGYYNGQWSDPINFTTTCLVDNLPYTYVGTSTKIDSGCLKFFDSNHDGYTWRMQPSPDLINVVAPGIYGNQRNDNDDWFFTPYFKLTPDSIYILSFNTYSRFNNFLRSLEIKYGSGQHPDLMNTHPIYQNTMLVGSDKLQFKVPAQGVYTIGFHSYDEAASTDPFMVYNYSLKATLNKSLQPKFLKIDSIFQSGITFRWNAPDSMCAGSMYQWEVRDYYNNLISSGSTADTLATINYNFATYKGKFLIRSVCQGIPDDNWSSILLPENIDCYLYANNVPFFKDDFTADCNITIENSNNDGYAWQTHRYYQFPLLSSEAICYRGTRSANHADDWLFTRKINLQAGKNYKLSFRYKSSNGSEGKREKLEVKYGFERMSTKMFISPLFVDDAIATDTSDPYLIGESIINVSKDSSYSFGFHCFSDKDQARLFLDSILIEEETTLPVLEMNLYGTQQEENILLTWKTLSEINNKGFEIQRGTDGQHFSKISFKTSKSADGNSNSNLYYNALDDKPLPGSNYYRLKQIDKNGNWRYSNIVLVYVKIADRPIIASLYPNPASNLLNIQADVTCNGNVTIIIADIAGRKLLETSTSSLSGSHLLQIDISKLPKGVYLLQLQCLNGGKSDFRKFEKQ